MTAPKKRRPAEETENMATHIGYCEHCGWPVAPDGVTLQGSDTEPREGARSERCDDSACTVAASPDAWWAWHDQDQARWSADTAAADARCDEWVAGRSDDGPVAS